MLLLAVIAGVGNPATGLYSALAAVLLFGIYASRLAPITYMEGTCGPERMGDMMWFSYVFWIYSVEGYWAGWFRH